MSEFQSKYSAKQTDANGYANYSAAENRVWQELYERQINIVQNRACSEYLGGLQLLNLNAQSIPQVPDINAALKAITGWQVSPVQALIAHEEFFNLLANRQFPAATFIRHHEELDYVQEPDIFHEIFGHCPMLTEPHFAEFIAAYGELVLKFPEKDLPLLQRLFWFTVEFGLINSPEGLRTYGGGILSSKEETIYCIESDKPQRLAFNPLDALRTPYRIDILQPVYFVIDSFEQLYDFIKSDIAAALEQARALGEYAPRFPVEDSPAIHIHHC